MGPGLVMLREGVEASLIVVIVVSFLTRTGRRDGLPAVWAGVGAALVVSLGVGLALAAVGSELEGRAEAVWEACTMLAAAGLLAWMILWMRRQARTLRGEIEGRVQVALARGSALGLTLVVFVGVLREGVETAVFLSGGVQGTDRLTGTVGALAGLAGAVVLGALASRYGARLDLRRFFTATSVLLLAFAAYLALMGLYELGEAGVVPEATALVVAALAAVGVPVARSLRTARYP